MLEQRLDIDPRFARARHQILNVKDKIFSDALNFVPNLHWGRRVPWLSAVFLAVAIPLSLSMAAPANAQGGGEGFVSGVYITSFERDWPADVLNMLDDPLVKQICNPIRHNGYLDYRQQRPTELDGRPYTIEHRNETREVVVDFAHPKYFQEKAKQMAKNGNWRLNPTQLLDLAETIEEEALRDSLLMACAEPANGFNPILLTKNLPKDY